ncbi:MAG: M14 family zinc carboxypeptidase [Anaerolineae bacterium]
MRWRRVLLCGSILLTFVGLSIADDLAASKTSHVPTEAQADAVILTPTAMTSVQMLLEVVTQTLTVHNPGDQALTLRLEEVPGSAMNTSTTAARTPMSEPTDTGPPQIEAQVLEAARSQGETDFWIHLAPQADLSPAYSMDWETRGRFVVAALRATAARSQAPVRAYLDRAGIDYTSHWIVNAVYVRGGDLMALEALQQIEGVTRIRAPRTLSIPEPKRAASPLSITPTATDWNLEIIQAPAVWAEGVRGEGIVVANIDTGVRYTHEALVAQYRGNQGGGTFDHDYNWYDPQNIYLAPTDDHGHGTHTMGIIVGDDGGTHQIGVAPGAQWIAADGCDGYNCPDEDIISSGEWLLAPCPLGVAPGSPECEPDLRPHIVNNSWGDCEEETTPFFEDVIDAWRAAGIFTAFANGNAGNCGDSSGSCDSMGNPARHYQVVSVGATTSADAIASFSLWGPTDDVDPDPRIPEFAAIKPDVSAPGQSIRSAYRSSDTYYTWMSGTSMATPHVAGVAALMLSANPGLIGQNDALEALLETSADPKAYATDCGNEGPGNVPNNAFGWGRVNALQAVEAARVWADVTWLATDPVTVTVPASATVDINVRFDASIVPTGVYTAALRLIHTETSATWATTPLTLTVVRDRVVRVAFASQAELEALASKLDIWEVHPDEGYVIAYARFWTQRWLLAEGYAFEPEPAYQFAPTTIPDYPCYRTIDEIDAQLDAWAATYPDLVTLQEIGRSYEGRLLRAVRLTQQATAGPKPPFLLIANIHGRELITNEAAMAFIERLLTGYGTDADLTWLLDEHEIYVLVSVNPDGHLKNEPGATPDWAYWRKNTQPYGSCGESGYGVDLNRNFDVAWGGVSASSSPCYETYRGPAAHSEPETQAVQAFARAVFTETAPGGLAISLHSYGDLVLWPWGYTDADAPEAPALTMLGEKLATFNGYQPQQASDLYRVSGTADDWLYGELGVPAYTFEIGAYADGFYPPCSRYDALVEPNLDAFVYAAKVARTPYTTTFGPDVASIGVTQETGAWQITATVDDRENGGQVITAAEVYVGTPPWDGGTPVALTAADGTFDTVTETVRGSVVVTGTPGVRELIFVRGRDADGIWGPVSAAFVEILSTDGTLRGTVFDVRSGAALADTLVTAQSPQRLYTTTTDAPGTYTFTVPPDTYTVTASHTGYYPLSAAPATLRAGQTLIQDFALTPWPWRLYLPLYLISQKDF